MRRELIPLQNILQSIVLLTPDRSLHKIELERRIELAAERAKECLVFIYSLKGPVRKK